MTVADCPKLCNSGTNVGNPCLTNGDCPLGTFNACVGKCDTATFGPWPFYKLSGEWGTAKVRGVQIRPGTTYRVQTQADFPGGAVLSSATSATTRK